MVKYTERKGKSRIKEYFQSISKQLSKENKKFQYSVAKKGSTASQYSFLVYSAKIIAYYQILWYDIHIHFGRLRCPAS